MCGRYTLTTDRKAISAAFPAELLVEHTPRYNISPSQVVPVLLHDDGGRRIDGYRWGLVPFWAKDPGIGYRMINARSETVAEKPAFRQAWRQSRRCLILADGFFEWQKPPAGKGPKQPHWIHMADGRPFGFAGLWEHADTEDGPLYTFTILTTRANELLEPIHDRMPVVLGDESEWNDWVNPEADLERVEGMLRPYPAEEMHFYAVSTLVNKPSNDVPECIEPLQDDSAEPEQTAMDFPQNGAE